MELGRHDAEFRKARKQVLANARWCEMPNCLYPNIPLRHEKSPRNHPLKATVDHLIPVKDTIGWPDEQRRAVLCDPAYLRPAHMGCNSARHATENPSHFKSTRVRSKPSRDWGI